MIIRIACDLLQDDWQCLGSAYSDCLKPAGEEDLINVSAQQMHKSWTFSKVFC